MKAKITYVGVFLEELFLYSGQYALFYVLMYLSRDGAAFINDSGHVLLVAALLIQTLFLILYGKTPMKRFLGTLIAPAVYTIYEIDDFSAFLLDSGHFYFWIFSAFAGFLQAAALMKKSSIKRMILEFSITFVNVFMFLFIYFYFDLRIELDTKLAQFTITQVQYAESLEFYNFGLGMKDMMNDRPHVYILIGGLLLGAGLGAARVKTFLLRERISELFGQYVDSSIRDKIIEAGGAGEKRNLAVLFSDIRNFTTLSEKNNAADIIRVLDIYFARWEKAASKHHGIINKFIGDAVMIIFGFEGSSGCSQAVSCAVDLLAEFDVINRSIDAEDLPVLDGIGIGINYGNVIAGSIGGHARKDYTVIGDTVNIASRVESLCKELKKPLLITADAYNELKSQEKDRFEFAGEKIVKGKTEPVKIYCIK